MAKKAQHFKNKKAALYAGSFDPFHHGHLDIVERALKVFDHIIVLVAHSPSKQPLLSVEDRVLALKELFARYKGKVIVDHWDGLTVDYAASRGIGTIVRGLRPTGDFDSEFLMASMNRELNPKIDTSFFMTGQEYYFLSSSLVREVFHHNGPIDSFVPKAFLKKMLKLK